MTASRLCVVIPAFNEGASIAGVVGGALEAGVGDVIVVDDGSTDETAAAARAAGAHVVSLPENQGYDAAIGAGFVEAACLGADAVVTLDADGEHDPALLAAFRRALLEDGVELVLGVRPAKARLAERLVGLYYAWVYGAHDILCGMKGYALGLWRNNGGFDHVGGIGTELAHFGLARGIVMREITVSGQKRADQPRFGRAVHVNLRILGAFFRVLRHARARG